MSSIHQGAAQASAIAILQRRLSALGAGLRAALRALRSSHAATPTKR